MHLQHCIYKGFMSLCSKKTKFIINIVYFFHVHQNKEKWKQITKNFEIRRNFPCFGATDGKYIVIKCPPRSGSEFYNYKGTFCIVLFVAADSHYHFTYVNIGNAGRASDGGTFVKSTLKHAAELGALSLPEDAVLVADDESPLSPYLMKPFSKHGSLDYKEKIFNYRFSRALHVVENTFGILASKFVCV